MLQDYQQLTRLELRWSPWREHLPCLQPLSGMGSAQGRTAPIRMRSCGSFPGPVLEQLCVADRRSPCCAGVCIGKVSVSAGSSFVAQILRRTVVRRMQSGALAFVVCPWTLLKQLVITAAFDVSHAMLQTPLYVHHSQQYAAHSALRLSCAGLRVLHLAGYSVREGNSFAALLPEIDIDTLPALPWLGHLSVAEGTVRSAPVRTISELRRFIARTGVRSGINDR